MPSSIYLDYVSSTPVHPEIMSSVSDMLQEYYANSDAIHDLGQKIASLLARSRAYLASYLKVQTDEVYFTSGASESNNTAIKGIALAMKDKGKHLITTQIEHSSSYESFRFLESFYGFEVTYLPVNQEGVISLQDLQQALRPDTTLVSLALINNEVGSFMPLADIVKLVKGESHAMLHIDGVQALGKYPLDLQRVDAASFSAHKLGGLKGSGLLMKKNHVPCIPLIHGGHQERGLRGGTSNAIPDILWAKTLRLSDDAYKHNAFRIDALYDTIMKRCEDHPKILLNSSRKGSHYIINFSVQGIPSQIMLNALNQRNIYVSAQSTCSFEANKPSRVLQAMGRTDEQALTSIRVSLSYLTEEREIKQLFDALDEIIAYVKH